MNKVHFLIFELMVTAPYGWPTITVCITLCACRECRVLRELMYCSSTVLEPDTLDLLLAECSPLLRVRSVPFQPLVNPGSWSYLGSDDGYQYWDSGDEYADVEDYCPDDVYPDEYFVEDEEEYDEEMIAQAVLETEELIQCYEEYGCYDDYEEEEYYDEEMIAEAVRESDELIRCYEEYGIYEDESGPVEVFEGDPQLEDWVDTEDQLHEDDILVENQAELSEDDVVVEEEAEDSGDDVVVEEEDGDDINQDQEQEDHDQDQEQEDHDQDQDQDLYQEDQDQDQEDQDGDQEDPFLGDLNPDIDLDEGQEDQDLNPSLEDGYQGQVDHADDFLDVYADEDYVDAAGLDSDYCDHYEDNCDEFFNSDY